MADKGSFDRQSGLGDLPPGPGRVTLVVGPSGAGKDAILQCVRERLAQDPRFEFPRRIVTRAASAAEDHDVISPDAFDARRKSGGFALHWQAHGLSYGISSQMDDAVRQGITVVFNASRQVVAEARSRYACFVVLVDAPQHIRAQRLANRNRERSAEVSARLERVVASFSAHDCDFAIDNSGTLSQASEQLTQWLLARADSRSAP